MAPSLGSIGVLLAMAAVFIVVARQQNVQPMRWLAFALVAIAGLGASLYVVDILRS